jgi:hypothetical protein
MVAVMAQPRFVMGVDTWMSLTEVRFKPRDQYLKAVDEALKQWHKAKTVNNLAALKLALHNWKMSRGYDGASGRPAWVTDDRNYRKGVEKLDLQLYGQPGDLMNSETLAILSELPYYGVESWADDTEAKQILKEARQESIHTLFAGREVIIKKLKMAEAIGSIMVTIAEIVHDGRKAEKAAGIDLSSGASSGSKWVPAHTPSAVKAAAQAAASPLRTPYEAAKSAGGALREEAGKLLQDAVNAILSLYPEVAKEVLEFLAAEIPNWMVEVAGAMVPYMGVALSAKTAFSDLKNAAKVQAVKLWQRRHIPAFRSGDPNAAVMALREMMDREIAQNLTGALVTTSEATIKIGAHTLDAASLGIPTVSTLVVPLTGLIGGIAKLLIKIAYLARDMHEKYQANLLLKNAYAIKLDAQLFETCPVLGCSYMANANLSDLVNFLIEDIGAPEWQTDIEAMNKKHIQPMVDRAKRVLQSSRLQVKGLELAKGAYKPIDGGVLSVGPLADAKLFVRKNIIMKFKSRLPASLPNAVAAPNHKWAAAQQGQQVVSPAVLKARISGIGPLT